jgi:hypothetical protein
MMKTRSNKIYAKATSTSTSTRAICYNLRNRNIATSTTGSSKSTIIKSTQTRLNLQSRPKATSSTVARKLSKEEIEI